MLPQPQRRPWMRDLDRLRWLGGWVPVSALAVLIVLAEASLVYLELSWHLTGVVHGLMLGGIAGSAYLLFRYLFGVVRRKEREILTERKRGEEALGRAREEIEVRVRERTEELVRANEALRATLAERERVEATLRDSQTQLAGIIASASDPIITMDEAQRIVVFNAAAERLFQVSATDALGQPVQRFIPERFQGIHQAGLAEFARSNFEQWWVGLLGGATARRPAGSEFPFEAAISQVEVEGRKLFTIRFHDTTAQQATERELRDSREQLRALAARLQVVREEERASLAWEIQDRLGQALAVLKMDLAWVASRLPAHLAPLTDRLQAMSALTHRTIYALRRIATQLRPSVLDDLGLVAALEWQVQEFQTRTGLRCEFMVSGADLPLPPGMAIALFRISQEALTNVARHAHATRVTLRVQEEPGGLSLVVTDNGRGISEAELAAPTSLGLLEVRERALRIGGEVSIVGRPGEGTTVTVRVPLPGPNSSLQEVREGLGAPDSKPDAAS